MNDGSALRPGGESLPRLQPIARTSLVDEIVEHLSTAIITGQLAGGTLLRQVDLAERFGVSRTPLREALRLLERDGLIRTANANNSFEVVAPTREEIVELYELREVLDGLAARLLAVRGISDDDRIALSEAVEAMDKAAESADLLAYRPYHTDFHARLIDCCGNRRVAALGPLVRLSAQMSVSRSVFDLHGERDLTSQERDRLRALLIEGNRDHRRIFDAVLAGDGEGAELAAREHITKALGRIRAVPRPT